MGTTGLFDLEGHFAFYGAYHSNPVNILIHTFFVWPLFFTAAVLFHFTPSLYNFSSGFNNHGFKLNLGFVLTFMSNWTRKLGPWQLCYVFSAGLEPVFLLLDRVFCWGGQFIGHGIFEKRAPALGDNFAQALLMGPYFVLLELLQSAFGYEPYPGFHKSVKAKIEANIKEWKDLLDT
ncbi:hypothetical protein DVH24_010706 [Malus domestica]|uniref:Uncharacterized protein n=1 Tax=Malus domestica TaxID=3750 RepID=A0A498JYY8_MALDO|nr:hypothetical protein DVH24_010706 [Malus domestica]